MGEGILSKIKGFISEPEDDNEYQDDFIEETQEEEDMSTSYGTTTAQKAGKVLNLHSAGQMKVVIVEPKKYEEVTTIADHLKQRKAVIVNLEGLMEEAETRRAIFNFMQGAVYVLDGNIQKVSKAIFILAPNNVDIDANIKKELESKAFFPWQNK